MKIDVIIPVYKPDNSFFQLIEMLEKQVLPIQNIILMNTEEKYFEQLLYGKRFLEKYHNIKVYHLSKKEFDHGLTRCIGVSKSDAEVFLMMTQDAIPVDEQLTANLMKSLEQENVAAAYGRQMAKDDCNLIERYTRSFNYPDTSTVKSQEDLEQLGIKTYFCSNVCCMYRREDYDRLGGFVKHAIFNEDMLYAAKVIQSGKKIAYAAEAKVFHSHNYTGKQQFQRNFDLGVSHADHPEVFAEIPAESEGIKSVKATAQYLKEQKKGHMIPQLVLYSGCKYMGYLLGKHYKKLPKKLVLSFTMNKDYWRHKERKKDVSGIDATKGYGRSEAENNRFE